MIDPAEIERILAEIDVLVGYDQTIITTDVGVEVGDLRKLAASVRRLRDENAALAKQVEAYKMVQHLRHRAIDKALTAAREAREAEESHTSFLGRDPIDDYKREDEST